MIRVFDKLIFIVALFCCTELQPQLLFAAPHPIQQSIEQVESEEHQRLEQEAQAILTELHSGQNVKQKQNQLLKLGRAYANEAPRLAWQWLTQLRILSPWGSRTYIAAVVELSKIQLKMGAYRDVLVNTAEILPLIKTKRWQKFVHEWQTEAYYGLGNTKAVAEKYPYFKTNFILHRTREDILRIFAISLLAEQKNTEAYPVLEILALSYPTTSDSRWAFQILLNARKEGYTFSMDFLKSLNRFSIIEEPLKKLVVDAIENEPIRNVQVAAAKPLTPIEKILAFVKIREFDRALAIVDKLQSQTPVAPDQRLLLLGWQARLHSLAGRYAEADEFYGKYFQLAGEKAAPNVNLLDSYARNLAKQGRYEEAANKFADIARVTGSSANQWFEFWYLYLSKKNDKAMTILQKLANYRRDPMDEPATQYWSAKLLAAQNKKAQSTTILNNLLSNYGEGYYVAMILNNNPELKSKALTVENVPNTSAEGELGTDGEDDSASPIPTVNLKSRDAYPTPFAPAVQTLSQTIGIDPYLVWSIMRAESAYHPDAVSLVGAKGLMQMMPYTAIKLAQGINVEDFAPNDLLNPVTSIAYGAMYLRRLLDYYNNHYMLAIAAYNAGPQAVNAWLAGCIGCAPDEFVESVPYPETRQYIKKVMNFYQQYLRIYEKDSRLPILGPLPMVRTENNSDIF